MQLTRSTLIASAVFVATLSAAEGQEVYVPNYDDQTVSVLDAVTLAPVGLPIAILPPVTAACPLGGNPDAVQFTRNHAYAFVTIDSCDQIAVIDTATHAVEYLQALPALSETRIFRSPRDRRMYVTTCGFPHIAVLDVRTRTVIDVIEMPDGGTYPMAFSPNGRIGYAGNGPALCASPMGIYRLDLRTNTVLDFISTTKDIAWLTVHPRGEVALATSAGSSILVVDLVANAEAGVVMCGVLACVYTGVAGIEFDDAGTRAYAVDAKLGPDDLVTIDTTDPLNPQELSRTPIVGTTGSANQLVVSGDRAHVILFNSPTASEVVLFDISTDPPVQLPGLGLAGVGGFELDVWGAGCGTRGHDSLHDDQGNHTGHCKPPNNGSGRGRKNGHN